jgi:hypothetical protein
MNKRRLNLTLVACAMIFASVLSGCGQHENAGPDDAVLRVHDVSGVNVEQLDSKLNELLSRDDLPLRGKVTLLAEGRLAVNASRFLQDEISAMVEQIRDQHPINGIQRPLRVEFWLLRMAKDSGTTDVPVHQSNVLEPLLAEYEGYGLPVYDYLESFHSGIASVDHIRSGQGTSVYFGKIAASEDGIEMAARVVARSSSKYTIDYRTNHQLQPGKLLSWAGRTTAAVPTMGPIKCWSREPNGPIQRTEPTRCSPDKGWRRLSFDWNVRSTTTSIAGSGIRRPVAI